MMVDLLMYLCMYGSFLNHKLLFLLQNTLVLQASGGLLCHLQKTIKHESSERQTCITNFNTSLVKDIDELKQEVKELKRDVEGSSYWPCRDWENRNNKRFSQIICSLVCCV
ncbi:uncharacterized protein LOC143240907 isoform X1 [Tachypleus tridentatus]|uniref:uncharacterized protein LOC143240907 isoform X1 n=1 Tax=Tachypleus tridentatus TaxID=6853 RepID=UPI003FCF426C